MLEVSNLNLQYAERILFKNESFRITERERIGVVGRNGAGKSTLFKLLMGMIKPDGGSISMSKGENIALLGQELEMDKSKSVLESTMDAFAHINEMESALSKLNTELSDRTDYNSDSYAHLIDRITHLSTAIEMQGGSNREGEAEKILKGLGFQRKAFDNAIGTLSGGWQMRVELAKLLLQQPTYLLLDEPTNHLDIESIIWLEKYFENYPGSVLIISHDVMFLENTCNRILDIELGSIQDYKSHYKKYLEQKAVLREQQVAAYENQQKEIKAKQELIDRFRAKATKARMAQSLIKQLDKMERIDVQQGDDRQMNISFRQFDRSALQVLKAKNLSKSFGDKKVLQNIDFTLERGERVAFVGQNGQGKSTLVKILVGELEPTSGEAEIGANAQLAYYAQNQADVLDTSKTVLESIEAVAPEEMRTKVRGILGSFMFSGDDVDKKVSVLSGGERARLALAKLILRPINLLVLDEPTNHLDIVAKKVLKDALKSYEGTLLIVSHDRAFLSGLTTKVVEFRDRKVKNYLGDINYFLEKREMDNMRQVETQPNGKAGKTTSQKSSRSSALSHSERKAISNKIRKKERQLEQKEQLLSEVEAKLMDPDTFKSSKGGKLQIEHARIKAEIEDITAEWEALVESLDL